MGGTIQPLLHTHRQALERARKKMNLVGPGPVDLHYRDCAEAVRDLNPRGRWADLGTGAGFPGIVFAAHHPDVPLDLVDSRRKRCAFLERVLAEGRAPATVQVRCTRIEDLPAGSYDGVMARALAQPEVVLGHAARLLRPGGRCVVMLTGQQPMPSHSGLGEPTTRAYEVEGKARVVATWTRCST